MTKMPTRAELAIQELGQQLEQCKRENRAMESVVRNQYGVIQELYAKLERKPRSTGPVRISSRELDDVKQQCQAARNALLAKQLELYALQARFYAQADYLYELQANFKPAAYEELGAVRKMLNKTSMEAQRLQQQLDSTRCNEKQLKAEIERIIAYNVQYERKIELLQAKAFEHEREMARLASQVTVMKKQANSVSDSALTYINAVQKRCEDLQSQLNAKNAEISGLAQNTAQASEYAYEIARLQQNERAMQKENNKLKRSNNAYATAIRKLESECAAYRSAETALREQLDKLASNSARDAQCRESSYQQLQIELTGAYKQLQQSEQQLQALNAQIAKLQAYKKASDTELQEKSQLIQKIKRSNADVIALIKVIGDWVHQVDCSVTNKQEMQAYIDFIDRGKQELKSLESNTHAAELQRIFDSLSNICNGLIM